MTRKKLTPSIAKRIVKAVRDGAPPEMAARMAGIPLDLFADWMTKKGRKYRTLQQAVDQAEAQAAGEFIGYVRKAAKGGKASAAMNYLRARASAYFPASRGLTILNQHNTTLVQQIKALEATRAEFVDPRYALAEVQEREQALADLDRGVISYIPDPALGLPSQNVTSIESAGAP